MRTSINLIRLSVLATVLSAVTACTQPFQSLTSSSEHSDATMQSASQSPTKYGILYLTLGCLGTDKGTVYDVSAGQIGPVGAVHFWGKPDAGYYCPVERPDVIRRHAELLRDAGIDFVMVDGTNFVDRNDQQSRRHFLEPLKVMLDQWSQVPNAPKISVWVPMKGDVVIAVDELISQYPNMLFQYQGKPLMEIVSGRIMPIDDGLWNRFAQKYTLKKMWRGTADPNEWTYMSSCQPGFKESNGYGDCNQSVTRGPDGQVEQVSVTSAYSENYFSDTSSSTSVPKFDGRTLQAQFKVVDRYPNVPLVMIASWNEWVAYRFCLDAVSNGPKWGCDAGDKPYLPNGNPAFIDQYNADFNKDLEPGGGYGDRYYQLLKSEIGQRKNRVTVVPTPPQPTGDNQVRGFVDRVEGGNGQVVISGWACTTGLSQAIEVHVYLNGAAGQGGHMVASGVANQFSEGAVGQACGDASNSPHRYSVTLSEATARANQGQSVYVHGINPTGGPNLTLDLSGQKMIPDPGQAPQSAVASMSYSQDGPIANQVCTQLLEPSDLHHTWGDNFLCSTRDLGLRWSYAGTIPGMTCTQINEPSDRDAWDDNYLCAPTDLGLQWSYNGPINGRQCVRIYEDADPDAWGDNYLCGP